MLGYYATANTDDHFWRFCAMTTVGPNRSLVRERQGQICTVISDVSEIRVAI
jgi:hypothetical protein